MAVPAKLSAENTSNKSITGEKIKTKRISFDSDISVTHFHDDTSVVRYSENKKPSHMKLYRNEYFHLLSSLYFFGCLG